MDALAQSEGAPRTVSAITAHAQDIDRAVRNGWVMNAGELELFFTSASTLSLSLSPSPTEGRAPSYSDTAGTPFVTATPTGGQGPFSYSWAVTSFQGASPRISQPSNASTTFLQSGLSEFDANDCVFTGTVTDALGATVSASVSVTFFGPVDRGDLR